MSKRILVVEDEIAIQNILSELLRNSGYDVDVASDGMEGIDAFHANKYDLIMLDIMMPKIDGFVVCEMIRKESDVPVIILTALDSEDQQLKGFELLADDYITKPFSLKLVLKRVEAVFRRTKDTHKEELLIYKDIEMNLQSHTVTVDGESIDLTKFEFDILQLFLKNRGRVYTRDDLLTYVWGYNFLGSESGVNFHIMNLRKKLNRDYIKTIRGVGYKIEKEN